jgi:hypothetical protein
MSDSQLLKAIRNQRYWLTSLSMLVYVQRRRLQELKKDHRYLRMMEREAQRRGLSIAKWKRRRSVLSVIATGA